MKSWVQKIRKICQEFGIVLCYLFGSQKELGKAFLEGTEVRMTDSASDIDFAVLFRKPPKSFLQTYALLSLELQELVHPFKADLLFLQEVDHLIQLEAIRGINIFSKNKKTQDEYEERVLTLAADEYEIFKRNEKDLFEAIDNGYFEFEYQND